jgi:NADPH-dependent 2,4-dienoyl-CoA reductase/sulfur reductase-like enzyme/rhodanese-related sulfurtransferase
MSCAARLKRLDDSMEVVVFERGKHVSYANCGMPYFVGGVIEERKKLLVQTPETLRARYGLDVRTRHEVTAIHRDSREVEVKNLDSGELRREPYDYLVLATGAGPVHPPIPGADGPNVYALHDLEDMDRLAEATARAKRVCVIGAGFIGLELVENLRHRGIDVSLVELQNQVMPPMDREMARPLVDELKRNGVEVFLESQAERIEADRVILGGGTEIPCDAACLVVGVRPNSELARSAGLELGARGHIRVDAQMRTSDPNVFAVGDVVETREFGTGAPAAVPLAGPANRQGRIAADNICGRASAYRDTQGTAIVRVFKLAAAITGRSEKQLKREGVAYRRVYVHPTQHPGYYPGAKIVDLKLLFDPEGKILGAQAVGEEGVSGIIDVLSTAMRGNMTVQDLEHLELAYSPQWGAAKHAINMAGFAATNVVNGDVELVEPDELPESLFLLDCRTPAEVAGGIIPGAATVPVDELRQRAEELPKDRTIGIYCAAGLRGYVGYRHLKQLGFDVRNLNGGYRTWRWFQEAN